MANVTVFELRDELAGVEVPDLDRFVITCADESPSDRVERKSANELVVTGKSSNAFSA